MGSPYPINTDSSPVCAEIIELRSIVQLQYSLCVAVGCSVVQCGAVWCSVVQCSAVCCSVLQCAAVCCSVLQCAAVCCSVLQCATVCCNVLQCVAVCCRVLQLMQTKITTISRQPLALRTCFRGLKMRVSCSCYSVLQYVLQCRCSMCCSVVAKTLSRRPFLVYAFAGYIAGSPAPVAVCCSTCCSFVANKRQFSL